MTSQPQQWAIALRSPPCRPDEPPVPNTCATKRVTLLLDSRDRDANLWPSAAQFAVPLHTTLYNVSSAQLKSAELPTANLAAGEAYVLLRIDELNAVQAAGTSDRAFAKVPVLNPPAGATALCYDKVLTSNDFVPPVVRLDRLTVRLAYHDGTPVDLGGGDWSATMELACTQSK